MKAGRALTITRKTLRELKHDRRTVAFLVLMPLLLITIFGYTFGGELKDVSIIVIDESGGSDPLNAAIIAYLLDDEALDVDLRMVDGMPEDALRDLEDGKVWAVLVFPDDLSEVVAAGAMAGSNGSGPLPVIIHVDSSNPDIAQSVIDRVSMAMAASLESMFGISSPVTFSVDKVYGEDAKFIDYFAPGVMGLAAMMITFMLSIISFVHERSSNTLDRMLSSPVTEGEFVLGYALAFGLVALVQSSVIMVSAVLLFDIMIAGNALLALLVIFLLGIGSQGLGFVLSSNARNEFQAVQFMPLIIFPSILLAGVFWPLEAVPTFLRPVSYFIPLTYAVNASRSVMIRGWGIGEIWSEMLILVAFAAAMLLLSVYGLKRRRP